MVKNYTSIPEDMEVKKGPSNLTLQFILNYSKSVEAKKTKQQVVLYALN